jgi:hypothetical protein
MKRYAELENHKKVASGRGYLLEDAPLLLALGAGSGLVAVLVVALYINGDEVHVLYGTPQLLWTFVPALLYWISRAWLIAGRGNMHDDPVVFALRDRVSLLLAAACALVAFLASVIK